MGKNRHNQDGSGHNHPAEPKPSGQEETTKAPDPPAAAPPPAKVSQETVTAVFIRQYTIDATTYKPARTERKLVKGTGRNKLVKLPADRADLPRAFFDDLKKRGIVKSANGGDA